MTDLPPSGTSSETTLERKFECLPIEGERRSPPSLSSSFVLEMTENNISVISVILPVWEDWIFGVEDYDRGNPTPKVGSLNLPVAVS